MDITVRFPGGKRVDATFPDTKGGLHVVQTDQPATGGGEDLAPAPFDLFLASIATCAGIYVLGFCQARNLPTDGISLRQHHAYDPATKQLASVALEVVLPADFPDHYRAAVVKAAENCKVKKVLAHPPQIAVTAVTDAPVTDGRAA